MKIALVCDDLVQHGGHERVVMDICELFPDAPLYTTLATKEWQKVCRDRGVCLKTSYLQLLPFKKVLNKFYASLLLHAFAIQDLKLTEYDVVISISARFAHWVVVSSNTTHICYMSTVGRMFWEPHTYFKNGFVKRFVSFLLSAVRTCDFVNAAKVDYFIANSVITQKRIKKYYRRDSKLIHPGVGISVVSSLPGISESPYFLVVTRLVAWKNVDIAIKACQALKVPLKIIGEGPDKERLHRISKGSSNVEFLGYVSEQKKLDTINGCLALINTQYEDFGIAPVEAMLCGKPVIAYAKGGVLETVVPGITGDYFYEQTPESLATAIRNFDASKYLPQECKEHASMFSASTFKHKFASYTAECLGYSIL